jgi:hypothetical protein
MNVYKQKFLEEHWQYVIKDEEKETRFDAKYQNGRTTVYVD